MKNEPTANLIDFEVDELTQHTAQLALSPEVSRNVEQPTLPIPVKDKPSKSKRQLLFGQNSYDSAKLVRDLDDSSDEDEIEKANDKTIDYEKSFFEVCGNAASGLGTRLTYVVHLLANQLYHSSEVNDWYYNNLKKVLRKFENQSFDFDLVLKKLIEESIEEVIKKVCNLCLRTPLSLIDDVGGSPLNEDQVKSFSADVIQGLAFPIQNIVASIKIFAPTNRTEFYNQVLNYISSQLFIVPIIVIQEIQKKNYSYRQPKIFGLNDLSVLQELAAFKPKLSIIYIAVKSIDARLTDADRIPGINSPSRNAAFQSSWQNLAAFTWNTISDKKERHSAAGFLLGKESELTIHYISDLLLEVGQSQAWQEIQAIENRSLINYLFLNDNRLTELVNLELKEVLHKKMPMYFAYERPTLGTYHLFESETFIQLVGNLRLAHRSLRRESKNQQDNKLAKALYVGNSPRTFHYHWSFFKEMLETKALETQTMHAGTETRGARVNNAGTYEEVNKQITTIMNLLTQQSIACNDAAIALWIRQIAQGKFNPKILQNLSKDSQLTVLERLSAITYLLLGCEVARNPNSLIIQQMGIDLVLANKYQWKDLLSETSLVHLPMVPEGSIERARLANVYWTQCKSQIFNYTYDKSVSLAEAKKSMDKIAILAKAECTLLGSGMAKTEGI